MSRPAVSVSARVCRVACAAGSTTQVPDPWRVRVSPADSSCTSASRRVRRVTPSRAASTFSDGKRLPGGKIPWTTSRRSSPATRSASRSRGTFEITSVKVI